MHLGIASAIAVTRKNWCIPRLCPLLEKHIHHCNVYEVFVTKPMKPSTTASLPNFRLEAALPFQQTDVDFAGPLVYRKKDKPKQKAYINIYVFGDQSGTSKNKQAAGCWGVPKQAKIFYHEEDKIESDSVGQCNCV